MIALAVACPCDWMFSKVQELIFKYDDVSTTIAVYVFLFNLKKKKKREREWEGWEL